MSLLEVGQIEQRDSPTQLAADGATTALNDINERLLSLNRPDLLIVSQAEMVPVEEVDFYHPKNSFAQDTQLVVRETPYGIERLPRSGHFRSNFVEYPDKYGGYVSVRCETERISTGQLFSLRHTNSQLVQQRKTPYFENEAPGEIRDHGSRKAFKRALCLDPLPVIELVMQMNAYSAMSGEDFKDTIKDNHQALTWLYQTMAQLVCITDPGVLKSGHVNGFYLCRVDEQSQP